MSFLILTYLINWIMIIPTRIHFVNSHDSTDVTNKTKALYDMEMWTIPNSLYIPFTPNLTQVSTPDDLPVTGIRKRIPRTVNRRWRKDVHNRPPSAEECIADQFNYAIIKGCLCYLFQSNGLSNGTFAYSPTLYPQILNTSCLIYTFVGDVSEIVHLEIKEMNLPQANNLVSRSYADRCNVSIQIHDQLDRAELKQNDKPNHEICGSLNRLTKRHFYSRDRVLIAELRWKDRQQKEAYFSGVFQFKHKNSFQSAGIPINETQCDRLIRSPHLEDRMLRTNHPRFDWIRNDKFTGQVFSPHYPQNYPKSTRCNYYFVGHSSERVRIELKFLKLWSSEITNCKMALHKDILVLSELSTPAPKPVSFTAPIVNDIVDYKEGKTISSLCGKSEASEFVSDGPNMLVQFFTDSQSRGDEGFHVQYQFVSRVSVRPTLRKGLEDQLFRDPAEKEYGSDQSEQFVLSQLPNQQQQQSNYDQSQFQRQHVKHQITQTKNIWMDPRKPNGVLESPNYPQPYLPNSLILYIIHIPLNKMVRVKFLDFQLDEYLPDKCTQSTGDRIELYEESISQSIPFLILCGNDASSLIRQRYGSEDDLISTASSLQILFYSDKFTTTNERGFIMYYEYDSINQSQSMPDKSSWMNLAQSRVKQSSTHLDRDGKNFCEFLITSNGTESSGIIHIPDYSWPISNLSDELNSKPSTQSDMNSCRWKLEGKPGQRIQIRLLPRPKLHRSQDFYGRSHDQRAQNDQLSRTDWYNGASDSRTSSSSSRSVSNSWSDEKPHISALTSLRCHTPVSLELVNYRSSSMRKVPEFLPLAGSSPLSETPNSQYTDQSSIGYKTSREIINQPDDMSYRDEAESSDPFRICAMDTLDQYPNLKAFMSGYVPRLDVVLRVNRSDDSQNAIRTVPNWELDFLKLGYDIQYKFVTDYGVLAPFGFQRKPNCLFEFHRSRSVMGNFSSPNYPGLYPIDLVCEYRFSGSNVRRIDIKFLEFDVESASKTCSDDRMGDHVELSSCFSAEIVTYPKKRLCHKQNHKSPYKIQWYESCLNMRFYSNGMYVRDGFFGIYEFIDSGGTSLRLQWTIWLTIICLILFHF